MAHTYTEGDHQKAYELWLALNSCRKISEQPSTPSAWTLSQWMKENYTCALGCPWHGWQSLKLAGVVSTATMSKHIEKTNLGLIESKKGPHDLTARNLIFQRRKEQLFLRFRGGVRETIYPVLSAKYGCSEATLDDDWTNRDEWQFAAINLADVRDGITARVGMFEIVQETLWNVINMVIETINAHRVAHRGAPITPSILGEIIPAVVLLKGLLQDVTMTAERSVRCAAMMGIHLTVAVEDQPVDPDIIDIEGTALSPIEYWSIVLGGMDDDSISKFFESVSTITSRTAG